MYRFYIAKLMRKFGKHVAAAAKTLHFSLNQVYLLGFGRYVAPSSESNPINKITSQ